MFMFELILITLNTGTIKAEQQFWGLIGHGSIFLVAYIISKTAKQIENNQNDD